VFIGGVMVNMFNSSVVDHVFIVEHMFYHTWGKHANHYTTDEHMIYHTWGKHVTHYTTDEHMFYHTWGKHAQVW
jgi:hypothetical protein